MPLSQMALVSLKLKVCPMFVPYSRATFLQRHVRQDGSEIRDVDKENVPCDVSRQQTDRLQFYLYHPTGS